GPRRPRGPVERGLPPPGRPWDLAAVGLDDPEPVSVDLDRMAVHAEVPEAQAEPLPSSDDQRRGSGEGAAIEGEYLEVRHDVRVRGVGPGVHGPLVRDAAEVAVSGRNGPRCG